MATTLSNELSGIGSTPVVKASATAGYGARLRRYRATITLASQAFGAGNEIFLAYVPAGLTFAYGAVTSSVSLGTSTISVGTAASVAKYKAAATSTAVDTPTLFGTTATVAQTALTAEEQILLQVLIANLPASGTLVVDLYFSTPT
jgi:hypothetical protein